MSKIESGASMRTLLRRLNYGGRKARSAMRRLLTHSVFRDASVFLSTACGVVAKDGKVSEWRDARSVKANLIGGVATAPSFVRGRRG